MSARNDKPNPVKTGTGSKKKVPSKGKKTESIVPDLNAASGESAEGTSKTVETLPSKNVAKKSTKSSTKISKEYKDAQKSANTDLHFNPKDLEKKCYVTKSAKSVNTGHSSKSKVVEEESCHQSGSDKDLKKQKQPVKEPDNSSTKMSEKKLLKRLEINKYTNFMKDFDPEKSQREARKLENLPFPEKKKVHNDNRLFDENGIYIETGQDLCDCLIEDCPGCHFPCHKCRSLKCGHACRRNRTWCYDEIEIEGTGIIIKRKK